MIARTLAAKLREVVTQFPVVTLTGPRQSGKTTLVRSLFPDRPYISLEAPDHRAFARSDPRGFLAQFHDAVILDEAQQAPDLFSYIQGLVDERPTPGRFLLTGSQNFLLMEGISQSLAGRTAVLHLLPFSLSELEGRSSPPLATLSKEVRRIPPPARTLMETLFLGLYPPVHDRRIPAAAWFSAYYQTYVERDVRRLINVRDLETFSRFVRLCAARNGQLLNLSSLAADCGITHTTARRWISVLEASFLVVLLRPHHRNFGKRLIRSPKLYFLDPGLLCFLLRVRDEDDLRSHAQRGAIFETFVLAELHKNAVHRGSPSDLYFWRDVTGHEVDFLIDLGRNLISVEAKSAETVAEDFFDGSAYWQALSKERDSAALVYGGDRAFRRKGVTVHPWFAL